MNIYRVAAWDEAKFIEAGAFGYLLKPFIFEEVEELVGQAINPRG